MMTSDNSAVELRRQGPQDYQVWLRGCFLGRVWKTHRSGRFCSAGNAGFANRTRRKAVALLRELTRDGRLPG